MPALNNQQFHDLLKTEGGFSVSETTGESPVTGYMVARYGHESTHPGVASPEQIGSFRQQNQEVLRERGAFFGGWFDTGENETALDASRQFTRKSEAHAFGRANAQKAGYDVARGADVPIQYGPRIPWRGTGRTAEQQRSMISERNKRYQKASALHAQGRMTAKTPEQIKEAGSKIGEAVYEAEKWREEVS